MRSKSGAKLLFSLILFVCSSCSTIRMKYEADVDIEGKRTVKYEYQKSYDVGSIPVFCGLTFWYLGGACWYYLVMPTVPQETAFEKDAMAYLDAILKKKNYKIQSSKSDRESWDDLPEQARLDRLPVPHPDTVKSPEASQKN